MKYLVLVLVLVAVYWLFISSGKKRVRDRRPGCAAEDMVRCAECGVYLPRSESVTGGEGFFCTTEHRRLHQKTG